MRILTMTMILFTLPATAETTFHFYGAEDCPPCMAFKRNYLSMVQTTGEASGFIVAENVIARTTDVPMVGIFGETDSVLRDALAVGDLIPYPPIFFVTRNDAVLAVHGPDWQGALDRAKSETDE